jgi:hypothetical protein
MELKESEFSHLIPHLAAACNGHFLKGLCGTFTLSRLWGGYFTQDMYAHGKF